jgi:rhomboid protease GluP
VETGGEGPGSPPPQGPPEEPPPAPPPAPPAPRPEPLTITADMLAPPPAPPPADARDFERGMSMKPGATLALIAANVAAFLWQVATGALESEETILAAGAFQTEAVLRGEVWRMGTSMFLHGGVDHLLGNCMALYVLGVAAEHGYGWRKGLAIYLATGLAGSLLCIPFEDRPCVGASGAIFGFLGLMAATFLRHRASFALRDRRVGPVLAVWAGWAFLTGFLDPNIANWAHVGGFVAGAAAGGFLRPALLDRGAPGGDPVAG